MAEQVSAAVSAAHEEKEEERTRQRMLRWESWRGDRLLPPRTMYISPTYHCNKRCVYCVHSTAVFRDQNYNRDFDGTRLLRLVREGLELGVKEFCIVGGGEPFLQKDLALSMMREIIEGDAEGAITSNATYLEPSVLRQMVEMGWVSVVMSLDSHDERTADFLRGKGTFKGCVAALDALKNLKEEYDTHKPLVALNVVITTLNYNHVSDLIRFAADHGVWDMWLTPVTTHNKEMEYLKLNTRQTAEFQDIIRECIPLWHELGLNNTNLREMLDMRFTSETGNMIPVLLSGKEEAGRPRPQGVVRRLIQRIPLAVQGMVPWTSPHEVPQVQETVSGHTTLPLCFEPWSTIVVHPDGSLNPCQHNSNATSIGNRSLRDAWYNDAFLESMRVAHATRQLPDFCRKCCSAVVAQRVHEQAAIRVLQETGD